MSARGQETLKKNRGRLRQFLVAPVDDDLYDSRKATGRVPKQDLIAMVRAIILVAFAGGIVWFLLWKVAIGLWGKR